MQREHRWYPHVWEQEMSYTNATLVEKAQQRKADGNEDANEEEGEKIVINMMA